MMFLKPSPDTNIRQFGLMLLLSSLLLFTQLSMAGHNLEHLFHNHDELCDGFLALDCKSSTTAETPAPQIACPPSASYAFNKTFAAANPTQTPAIRGPPASSTL